MSTVDCRGQARVTLSSSCTAVFRAVSESQATRGQLSARPGSGLRQAGITSTSPPPWGTTSNTPQAIQEEKMRMQASGAGMNMGNGRMGHKQLQGQCHSAMRTRSPTRARTSAYGTATTAPTNLRGQPSIKQGCRGLAVPACTTHAKPLGTAVTTTTSRIKVPSAIEGNGQGYRFTLLASTSQSNLDAPSTIRKGMSRGGFRGW
jgi:hypothetical protein